MKNDDANAFASSHPKIKDTKCAILMCASMLGTEPTSYI